MIMLALLITALLQAAPVPPLPEWNAAPPLVYRDPPEITAMMNQFVANEVLRGRCAVQPTNGHYMLRVDVAVLVAGNGEVRAVVPRAIDCPTVEQYGAGLVQSFARNNLVAAPGQGDKWHRASLTFDWTE